MSWTASLDVACWFALVGYHDPAVYTARIQADEVYCYFNERNEDEYICRPKRPKRLEIGSTKLEEHAAHYAKAKKERDLAVMGQHADG